MAEQNPDAIRKVVEATWPSKEEIRTKQPSRWSDVIPPDLTAEGATPRLQSVINQSWKHYGKGVRISLKGE